MYIFHGFFNLVSFLLVFFIALVEYVAVAKKRDLLPSHPQALQKSNTSAADWIWSILSVFSSALCGNNLECLFFNILSCLNESDRLQAQEMPVLFNILWMYSVLLTTWDRCWLCLFAKCITDFIKLWANACNNQLLLQFWREMTDFSFSQRSCTPHNTTLHKIIADCGYLSPSSSNFEQTHAIIRHYCRKRNVCSLSEHSMEGSSTLPHNTRLLLL